MRIKILLEVKAAWVSVHFLIRRQTAAITRFSFLLWFPQDFPCPLVSINFLSPPLGPRRSGQSSSLITPCLVKIYLNLEARWSLEETVSVHEEHSHPGNLYIWLLNLIFDLHYFLTSLKKIWIGRGGGLSNILKCYECKDFFPTALLCNILNNQLVNMCNLKSVKGEKNHKSANQRVKIEEIGVNDWMKE